MKANSEKTKQSKKATRRVLAGVLCGASVLSLVLSLVMPPISQAIANDDQAAPTEETVMGGGSSSESTDVDNANNGDANNQNSDETENGASEGTVAADSTADGAEVKGAEQPSDAQPSDNENSDENAIAPVSAKDYQEVKDDVAHAFDNGGKFQLTGSAYSNQQIKITKDTTIDLNGNMLYHGPGSVESFIVVRDNATLTIEDSAKVSDATSPVTNNPGQLAEMKWTGNNSVTPQSLTYYETTSTPSEDKLGTTETTTKHVVSGFGAIVAASEGGSVKRVISVADGSTLNLNGGMITTPRALGIDGHVIFSQGAVYISGGYVTNGNGGGWGGGLCITGANASLEMTGGVVAGNKAASGGGIFANNSAVLNLSGGVISGNATYGNDITDGYNVNAGGYGGGVYTQSATVTISDSANITNNRAEARLANEELYNKGRLGGGGIASHGGTLSMTGGSVTANYSHEAGGGIYAGLPGQGVGFTMSSGFIAGNMSDNAEGGGLRISGGTTGVINAENASNRVYITNNKTMTGEKRGGDWGGGGVFIQKGGRLNIFKTLITKNRAGGWGGGVGACPTGETIVSHSSGAAIYDNADNVDQNGNKLTTVDQNGNEVPTYHYSAGGDNKIEDRDEINYVTPDFKTAGHKDFFLVRNKDDANSTIAVVLGKMLGGGSADWKGTCDGKKIKIDANGGAEAKWMFGLEANPSDAARSYAQRDATTIISGNYSYTHGGGIMTNGDLVVGKVEALNVYPAIKVKANKVFMKDGKAQSLAGHGYRFKLLGKAAGTGEEPYWDTNGKLQANGCEATSEFTVNTKEKMGEIVIDTAANYQSSDYDLYLVEVPIEEKGTKFDKSIYKIHVDVSDQPVEETDLLGIKIRRHAVNTSTSKVYVKKEGETVFKECDKPADFYKWSVDSADRAVSTVTIGNDSNPAFTNVPYQTVGSWTPQVTKKVDGGEMKKFKFELYTKNSDTEKSFKPIYKCTTAESKNLQIVDFGSVQIGPLGVNELDNNRQAQFTYYICECAASKVDGTKHEGYKNDTKTFKVVVTAKDDGNGHLNCTPVYYEVDANGHENKTPTDTPTFTNTYSTSLPLSGMSGVTLTYLAGAAVLCAAAAWMHIRRKANAKGGKRRE